MNPIHLLKIWLDDEKKLGVPNPQQAVLSTTTVTEIPHSRVVAIREINEESLIFFTQKRTRKVQELHNNPAASFTFWFEMSSREVILEGTAIPLPPDENKRYWEGYSREAQIRFYSYAETSSNPIANKEILELKKRKIELEYQNQSLPVSDLYYGFRFKPQRMVFYSYRTDELSDVVHYVYQGENWISQILSP